MNYGKGLLLMASMMTVTACVAYSAPPSGAYVAEPAPAPYAYPADSYYAPYYAPGIAIELGGGHGGWRR